MNRKATCRSGRQQGEVSWNLGSKKARKAASGKKLRKPGIRVSLMEYVVRAGEVRSRPGLPRDGSWVEDGSGSFRVPLGSRGASEPTSP